MADLVSVIKIDGFYYDKEVQPPGIDRLRQAYGYHNPLQCPYGYGGSVNVPGVDQLFEFEFKTKDGENFHVVDYGTKAGQRLGIILPRQGNKVNSSVVVLTKGKVLEKQLNAVIAQFTHYLEHPELRHDYWA